MSQKSVEGFHSDLSIDDRSTLDPTYTSESSVTSSTMSDEMDEPIFDEWNISDLELASEDVGSEEVEVAISGRNVGRGRARGRGRGGRGSRLVVGETSTSADPGQGRGVGRSRGGRGTTLAVGETSTADAGQGRGVARGRGRPRGRGRGRGTDQ